MEGLIQCKPLSIDNGVEHETGMHTGSGIDPYTTIDGNDWCVGLIGDIHHLDEPAPPEPPLAYWSGKSSFNAEPGYPTLPSAFTTTAGTATVSTNSTPHLSSATTIESTFGTSMTIGSSVSFTMWIRCDDTPGSLFGFSLHNGEDRCIRYYHYVNGSGDTAIGMDSTTTAGNLYSAVNVIPKGKWYHFAMSYTVGGNIQVWVDKVPIGIQQAQGAALLTPALSFRVNTNASATKAHFSGLRVYDKAISQTIVDADYTLTQLSLYETAACAYFGTIADQTASEPDMALTNVGTGVDGTHAYFEALGDSAGTVAMLNPSSTFNGLSVDRAVSMWYWLGADIGTKQYWMWSAGNYATRTNMRVRKNTSIRCYNVDGISDAQFAMPAGQWVHIVLNMPAGGNLQLYANSVPVTMDPNKVTNNQPNFSRLALFFPSDYIAHYTAGRISSFMFFQGKVLSQTEIDTLYALNGSNPYVAAAIAAAVTPAIAYWPFATDLVDEVSGSTFTLVTGSVTHTGGYVQEDAGADLEMTAPLPSTLSLTSCGMSAWVYLPTYAGKAQYLFEWKDSGAKTLQPWVAATGTQTQHGIVVGGTNYYAMVNVLPLDTWFHWALTYTVGGDINVWVNTVAQGVRSAPATAITVNTINRRSIFDAEDTDFRWARLKMYDRAITQADVDADYGLFTPPP